MSQDSREAILNDIRSRSLSFQSISKKHRVSISTVSRLAAENGLASPRKRSSAVEKPEHSYDREQRKSVLDRMLHSIDKMVERGGLSSRQLKDLAGAAKEIAASRRNEDTIPDPTQKTSMGKAGVPDGSPLYFVEINAQGLPKHLEIYFSVLDIAIARDRGDQEAEETAKERVRHALREEGYAGEIDYDELIEKADSEFHRDRARQEEHEKRLRSLRTEKDSGPHEA